MKRLIYSVFLFVVIPFALYIFILVREKIYFLDEAIRLKEIENIHQKPDSVINDNNKVRIEVNGN